MCISIASVLPMRHMWSSVQWNVLFIPSRKTPEHFQGIVYLQSELALCLTGLLQRLLGEEARGAGAWTSGENEHRLLECFRNPFLLQING